MKSERRQFKTGQLVSINGACVQADLVLHEQGLGKWGVAENHSFSEIVIRKDEESLIHRRSSGFGS
jgi:hypothetical protein